MAARLTALAGASDVFRGGVVAYTDDAKRDLLGVDADLLRRRGAVSREAALAMAQGARGRLVAHVGLATTGYAGPTGDAGLVFVAVALPTGAQVHAMRYPGDRAAVREAATHDALRFALDALVT
ncbi:MAG: nicotinamide-nucleotide amidase [Thermoplasmata archaeon]|nr:nicotinamide-nucleotide amidase [Thermoplasmata archaeon]